MSRTRSIGIDKLWRDNVSTDQRYQLEISKQRDAIWIHSFEDGSTVGRFGKMGVDIHNTVTEQLAGADQCRLCTHGRVGIKEWDLFREKALEFWNINIPKDAFNADLFKLLAH